MELYTTIIIFKAENMRLSFVVYTQLQNEKYLYNIDELRIVKFKLPHVKLTSLMNLAILLSPIGHIASDFATFLNNPGFQMLSLSVLMN